MKFTKGSIFSTTIYEYNSASDAKERYDVRVNEVKQEGGYKEIQFNHSGSECYGTIEDFQIKERITMRCVNSNYYVLSSVVSDIFDFDAEYNIKKFEEIMLNKIP